MKKKISLIFGMLILLIWCLSTICYAGSCKNGKSHEYDYPNCCPCGRYWYGTGQCPTCKKWDTRYIYRVDEETAPTCTTDGIKRSGYQHDNEKHNCITEETIPALGHSYGDWSYSDASQHVRTCTRSGCNHQDYENHTEGTAATCTSSAVCSKCGKEYGAPLGHNWGTEQLYSSATCTSRAVYRKVCSRCNTVDFSYGSSLGHSYPSSYSTTSDVHYKNCTRCNHELISEAHDDKDNDAKCDVCGYVMTIYVAKPTATSTSFTYGGSRKSIVLSGFDSSTMDITGNSAINAGSYTAVVSLKNTTRYKWKDGTTSSISFSWRIDKASILDSNAPKGTTLTYNGYSQSGVENASSCVITGTSSALHVGNYTAQVVPDSNHTWADGTLTQRTINWSITQKEVPIVWNQTTLYYDESKKIPTATATSVGTDIITVSATGSQTNPGTYTAVAVCAVSGNGYVSDYKFTNTSTSYTIKNGIIEGNVNITGTNMVGKTLYAKLNITKPTSGTTVSYQWYSNTSNSTSGGTAISGATSETYTISKGLVDKYIYVVATVSKQYYDTNAFKDITDSSNDMAVVSRKSMVIPTIEVTYSYTGAEQTVKLNNFDSTTMNISNNTRTDAGTQNVVVSLKDPANYQWPDKTTVSKNVSWTIEPKKVNAVWGSKTTFEYNGKEQAPEVGADSGITGETLNLTRTTKVSAGTYTSVASISRVTGGRGKASNYTLLNNSISYTISKSSSNITLSKDHLDLLKNETKIVEYTYNGDGTMHANISNSTIANIKLDTTKKTISVTGLSEGSIKVTLTADASTNYLTTSTSFTVSVHPSPILESVKINGGASTTKNVEVVMDVVAQNVAKIYVSNNSSTPNADATDWIDYKQYTKHILSSQNGSKTVYVWGKDEYDNITAVSTANINLSGRYSLTLKNNQSYLGSLTSLSKYAIKTDGGEWQWQESNIFTDLIPTTTYVFKTQLYDATGIAGESEELKIRTAYDADGKLYIEYLN